MHGSLPKVWWDNTTCLFSHELGSSGKGGGSFLPLVKIRNLIVEAKWALAQKITFPCRYGTKFYGICNTCTSTSIKPVHTGSIPKFHIQLYQQFWDQILSKSQFLLLDLMDPLSLGTNYSINLVHPKKFLMDLEHFIFSNIGPTSVGDL